jgi:hypothetical protein
LANQQLLESLKKETNTQRVIEKISKIQNIIVLELNFERYFVKTNQEKTIDFEEFIQFFDDMILTELLKLKNDQMDSGDVFDVLNEKNTFNYSLIKMVEENQIWKEDDGIMSEYKKLKENLWNQSSKNLFIQICQFQNDGNSYQNALNLSFELLKQK